MKEIVEKISSYNLFNYLLPGILFVIFLREITNYDLVQEDFFIGAFLYYFIGLVISRFGSLIISEFLQNIKFIKLADYQEFILASDKDQKIELFSEINNMYRTIISFLTLLLLAKLYEILSIRIGISQMLSYILLIIVLIILFIFSYKKQLGYIAKRISSRNKQ
ncbi:hypothetical protein FHG64_02775 [Antarcticibacterium flavum]|uniref:Uncharacterized protein n=1 Tax=Antarcticibacterium flavum TaxID=2058175 RepID=A0A5B7WZ58_9FLAO|nr:hypothetical protein [Antarcticibacterium sp. W02-3]QCY68399.1 hypothetical protein FHG64_02775 [Antarcticibacterium flavum]